MTDPRAERDRIRAEHLRPAEERSPSSARGLHHTALVSGDVERTVRFYQDVLGFPLTELIENRDYPGSSHGSTTPESSTRCPAVSRSTSATPTARASS
jgi:hypothetical protein